MQDLKRCCCCCCLAFAGSLKCNKSDCLVAVYHTLLFPLWWCWFVCDNDRKKERERDHLTPNFDDVNSTDQIHTHCQCLYRCYSITIDQKYSCHSFSYAILVHSAYHFTFWKIRRHDSLLQFHRPSCSYLQNQRYFFFPLNRHFSPSLFGSYTLYRLIQLNKTIKI